MTTQMKRRSHVVGFVPAPPVWPRSPGAVKVAAGSDEKTGDVFPILVDGAVEQGLSASVGASVAPTVCVDTVPNQNRGKGVSHKRSAVFILRESSVTSRRAPSIQVIMSSYPWAERHP